MTHALLSSRCAFASELCRHAVRKPFPRPLSKKMEGGEAPKGASIHWPHQRVRQRTFSFRPPPFAREGREGVRSPFGAPPRLSPAARRPTGSTPGHASWDLDLRAIRKSGNGFPKRSHASVNPLAGVTRLHLSQSRDCTSRTGRSTGMTDARSRPGAGRNAARRDRPRSTFESTLAKGPSVNEMGRHVIAVGTGIKGATLNTRPRKVPA
jgi:hypothetical protein